jgi:hypothetical protein
MYGKDVTSTAKTNRPPKHVPSVSGDKHAFSKHAGMVHSANLMTVNRLPMRGGIRL